MTQPRPFPSMPQMPLQAQQGGLIWMTRPAPLPDCPSGLEYLSQVEKLMINQQVDLLEAFTGWEENNRYVIRNSLGQQIYYAFESTDACMRQCCGARRGFVINIVDNTNQPVIKITREFKCFAGSFLAGCVDCCTHEVKIESPNGEVFGYIRQKWNPIFPTYGVLDANYSECLSISGPLCIFEGAFCPCENQFDIYSQDGSTIIGKITKEYSGFIKEAFTNADNFSVDFPIDLSVKIKSTLLGALFLIDFMFFEKKPQENNN